MPGWGQGVGNARPSEGGSGRWQPPGTLRETQGDARHCGHGQRDGKHGQRDNRHGPVQTGQGARAEMKGGFRDSSDDSSDGSSDDSSDDGSDGQSGRRTRGKGTTDMHGTMGRRRTLDWVKCTKLRERDRALRSVPVIVLRAPEPQAPAFGPVRAQGVDPAVSAATIRAAEAIVDNSGTTADEKIVEFSRAPSDVQSEVIRQTARKLLTSSAEQEAVGGGEDGPTLQDLQALLESFSAATSLSVGAVVALGEVCSRFEPADVTPVKEAWNKNDPASYKAWSDIAALGRRARKAEKRLEEHVVAVKELQQFLADSSGASDQQRAELDRVRIELRAVLESDDGRDEECARGVLQVLGQEGEGRPATCASARDAAEDAAARLQALKTELCDLRAAEPELDQVRTMTQELAQKAAALRQEEASVRQTLDQERQRARRALESETAAANEALQASESELQRQLVEVHAAREAMQAREAQNQETAEAMEREARAAADAFAEKEAQLQQELAAASANRQDAQRLADLRAQQLEEMKSEALVAVEARERALRIKEDQLQEARELHDVELRRLEEAAIASRSAKAEADNAREALAARQAELQSAAGALEKRQVEERTAAALRETQLGAKAEEARAVADAAEAVGRRTREAVESLAARTEAVAVKEAATREAAAAAAAKELRVRQAEAALKQREDVLQREAATARDHVEQLAVTMRAKDAELEREREECTSKQAELEAELRAFTAATEARTAALDAATRTAEGKGDTLNAELVAAKRELTEARAAQAAARQNAATELASHKALNVKVAAQAEEVEALRKDLQDARAAKQAAVEALKRQIAEHESQLRSKQEVLSQQESAAADSVRQLKEQAEKGDRCVAQLLAVLGQPTNTNGTCEVTVSAAQRIRELEAACNEAERARDAANDEARAVGEAAAQAAQDAKAGVAAMVAAQKQAVLEAETRAAAEAKKEAEVACSKAVAAAQTSAAAMLAEAKAEAQRNQEDAVAQAVASARAAEAAANAAAATGETALRAQVSELQKQLEFQTAQARTQAQRAVGVEQQQVGLSEQVLTLQTRNGELKSRVAELETQTVQFGKDLGCTATEDRPCDILQLLGNAKASQVSAHTADLDQLRTQHTAELTQAARRHAAVTTAMTAQHNEALQVAAEKHAGELRRAKEEWSEALQGKIADLAKVYEQSAAAAAETRAKTLELEQAKAQVGERDKQLVAAQEKLAADGRMRDAARGERAEVDKCVGELRALLPALTPPPAATGEASGAEQPHGAGHVGTCAVVRAAAAEIARLRTGAAQMGNLTAEQGRAQQKLQQAEQTVAALRKALGCGDAEDAAACGQRATSLLDLLRPGGTTTVDPVARAKELVEIEQTVKKILGDVAQADRSPLVALLTNWANVKLAKARTMLGDARDAGAVQVAQQVEGVLRVPKAPGVAPAKAPLGKSALALQGRVLEGVRKCAEERHTAMVALQRIAEAAGLNLQLPAPESEDAQLFGTAVRTMVKETAARMLATMRLIDVAVKAASAVRLVDNEGSSGWQLSFPGQQLALVHPSKEHVQVRDLFRELDALSTNVDTKFRQSRQNLMQLVDKANTSADEVRAALQDLTSDRMRVSMATELLPDAIASHALRAKAAVVDVLLELKADVSAGSKFTNDTPLTKALRFRQRGGAIDPAVLNALVNAGAGVDTPLVHAWLTCATTPFAPVDQPLSDKTQLVDVKVKALTSFAVQQRPLAATDANCDRLRDLLQQLKDQVPPEVLADLLRTALVASTNVHVVRTLIDAGAVAKPADAVQAILGSPADEPFAQVASRLATLSQTTASDRGSALAQIAMADTVGNAVTMFAEALINAGVADDAWHSAVLLALQSQFQGNNMLVAITKGISPARRDLLARDVQVGQRATTAKHTFLAGLLDANIPPPTESKRAGAGFFGWLKR